MECVVRVLFFLVAVIFFGQLATGVKNILYISSVASPSHFLWSQRLFERLAERGHNVTVVNLYKHGFVRGVQLVKLEGIVEELAAEEEDYVEFGQMSPFEVHVAFFDLELYVCQRAVKSAGFRSMLDYPKDFRFDLVIHDHLAGPCLLILLSTFGYPPLIYASAYNRQSTLTTSLGTVVFPGFVPNQAYDVQHPMTFYQKTVNRLLYFWEYFFKAYIYYPKLDSLIQQELNQTESVTSLEKRSLLAILNSNQILDLPEAVSPNIVQVGGLHIKPQKSLPNNLLQTLDHSNKVVLFSLGSNVRSDQLDPQILNKLIEAMTAVPTITFLWKLESDLPQKLPPNVITSPWFPQSELLAHPKLSLFITHGGLLSVQEAVWHGVPMLGMPIYGDQFGNVNQLINKGVAKRLSLVDATSEQLVEAIQEITTNASYRNNANRLSRMFRDRRESPLETAIWTIEWVLRNANDSHVWNHMPSNSGFLERYPLDVLLVSFAGLMATGFTALLKLLKVLTCTSSKSKKKLD
ncbi:hypothetical protein quinque_005936 [Culex quinquefasciatus]